MTAPIVVAGRRPLLRRIGSGPGGPALVLLAAAVAGFLLVGQVQGSRRVVAPLEAESEADLARILASLNAEVDALRDEITDLQLQRSELLASSERESAAVAAVDEQLRTLRVLAGTVPVTGPGVVVTVSDPEGSLTYDAMIDVVQELRDAGAEAIAIDGRRVGVASAFAEREGRITLDGEPLQPPYQVAAIGQPATLDSALKIPGGAVDTMSAVRGVRVEVRRQARVDLPALAEPLAFEVARPVGSRP
jgi:uncharacterized protein YlxW (UPF0749 family)